MISKPNRSMVAAAMFGLSLGAPMLAGAEPQSGIVGTVDGFHGKYGLVVRDVRGVLAEVTLHQGTIIKPEGLRLERGMIVAIHGQAADRAFDAAEIVAPFEASPFARKSIAKGPAGVDAFFDQRSPTPTSRSTRWQEGPDQLTAPRDVGEAKPHIDPH